MIFWIAKILEATGLSIILGGFIAAFPEIMSGKVFGIAVLVFGAGWLVERFFDRK